MMRLAARCPQRFGDTWSSHEDRLHAESFVRAHGVGNVFGVAVTVVGIDHERQRRGRPDFTGYRTDLGQAHQAHVWHRVAHAERGKASHEHALETRLLWQARAQAVVNTGQHERLLGLGELAESRW